MVDQVRLTRGQLKALAEKNEDVTILNDNQDAKMLLVVPSKYEGDSSEWRWMLPNGRYRKDDA